MSVLWNMFFVFWWGIEKRRSNKILEWFIVYEGSEFSIICSEICESLIKCNLNILRLERERKLFGKDIWILKVFKGYFFF